MGQDIKEIPLLFIHNYKLEVVHEFVYLGSTITDNLSIDSELNTRIGMAAMTLSRLTNEYGPTTSFQIIPKSMYIKPVKSALCFMEVSLGQYVHTKRKGQMCFTCAASDVF